MDFRLQAINEFPVASGNKPDLSAAHYRNERRQSSAGTERQQQDHPERTRRKYTAWVVHRDWISVAGSELPTRDEQAHEYNDREQSARKPHLTLSPFRLGAQTEPSSGLKPCSDARSSLEPFPSTISLSSFPTLKKGVRLAEMCTGAPVLGFRPSRASRILT
jgi:hypothetical protein